MPSPLIQTTGRRKESVARVRLRPGNGKVTVRGKFPYDYKKHFPKGRFAFQQHHPGSEVDVRNVLVRELPSKAD